MANHGLLGLANNMPQPRSIATVAPLWLDVLYERNLLFCDEFSPIQTAEEWSIDEIALLPQYLDLP